MDNIVRFAIFGSFVIVSILLYFSIIKLISASVTAKLQKNDFPIELAIILISALVYLLGDLYFGINGLAIFALLYGILGILIEYCADWLWYRIFGARLYVYTKKPWMKFTTFWNLPVWALGGVIFILPYIYLNIAEGMPSPSTALLAFLAFGMIGFIIYIVSLSIYDGLDKKLDDYKGFNWFKYAFFPTILWSAIFGGSVFLGVNKLPLYLIAMAPLGTLLEGGLGLSLKLIFGEKFWHYTRKPLIEKTTSWLILPLWPVATLMAILLWEFVQRYL